MDVVTELVHGCVPLPRVTGAAAEALRGALARLTGTPRFPGSNPCSLERADFAKLRAQPYWICEKTDGVRFLLFCTVLDGRTVGALVDRTLTFYLLPLAHTPTAMFQGTVVDCELARDRQDGSWWLLAFDAYVACGVPLWALPFSRRMACLRRALTHYRAADGDPLRVTLKDFFPGSMVAAYRESEPDRAARWAIDGVVLTPELSAAAPGRHAELFKLKTKHTVDFLVGDDGLSLSVFDSRKHAHVVVARLGRDAPAGAVVECSFNGLTWKVVCERRDKKTANDSLTYSKTLLNMREAIGHDELQRVLESPGPRA